MTETLWQLDGVDLPGAAGPSSLRLADVHLTLQRGVTAVLGASGAGKTSLINLLVGFERPQRGRITSHLPASGPKLPMYWVPQDDGLWPHLTARQHLAAVCNQGDPIDALLDAFELRDQAGRPPSKMSQGQCSRLSVARALAADPHVLVMDEPLAHVDPARFDLFWDVVTRHVERSCASLIFATHSPAAVLARADQVVCLSNGRMLYQGSVTELYTRPPTQQLMAALGEGNWFDPADAKLWLGQNGGEPRCYRPEQVAIDPADDGPFVVRRTRFAGAVAMADLEHEPTQTGRRIFHRPPSDSLLAGARVALRLLTVLALAVLAGGCGQGEDRTLSPKLLKYWQIPPAGSSLPQPRSVNIGPQDQVLVLDKAGRLLMFTSDGRLIRQWPMPDVEDGKPEDACWLKDGRIGIADTHYHRVLFFDQHGALLGAMGREDRYGEEGTFFSPVSVTQDGDENLYVSQYGRINRVQKFTRDGDFLMQFGRSGSGPGEIERAAGMVWYEGRIYLADAANHRVQVFDDDGRFVEVLGERATHGQAELNFPYDVAIDRARSDPRLYVIEWGSGRVSMFDLTGNLLGRFGSAGTDDGQFRTPWSIAVDSQSRLRVADTENRRVVELIFN